MEWQKDLNLRRGEDVSHIRMDAVNKEMMDHYFSLLKDTLDDYKTSQSKSAMLMKVVSH